MALPDTVANFEAGVTMSGMETAPGSTLVWLGVTEVMNRKRNAVYRANATTLVLTGMVLVVYLLEPAVFPPSLMSSVLFLAFAAIIAITWSISFAMGYVGLVFASGILGMPAGPVTQNTDMAPRKLVWAFRQSRWDENLEGDLLAGRLIASEAGLRGVIVLRWDEIQSISLLDAQTASMRKSGRPSYIPGSTREVVLHFKTSDDCSQFVQIVKERSLERRTL